MTSATGRSGIVIYNPAAGRGHAATARAEAQKCLGDAWQWRPTERPGHAVDLAREAAREGAPVAAAFGGDGTVGDVARGLLGTDAALGILPAGTGNDVARNLGLSLDLNAACAVLQGGRIRQVDMGSINGTPFLNNAGAGFDACVMQTMNTSLRFLRGTPAFVLAALKTFPRFQPFSLTLVRDAEDPETLGAMMVSVLNGSVYGAGMKACPGGRMDDGELDVLVIKAMPKHKLLALFPRVIAGQHAGEPAVRLFRARRLSLECDPPQPLNIDGDVSGTTPAQIAVQPGVLRVIAP